MKVGLEVNNYLEQSCFRNGYRYLDLDRCAFKTVHRGITSELFGKHPRFAPDWTPSDADPEIEMEIDSCEGGLVITETNV